jgi:hypothetical protein
VAAGKNGLMLAVRKDVIDWANFYRDWLRLRNPDPFTVQNWFSSEKPMPRESNRSVLVIFYEDLVNDFDHQIQRIFDYLESIWGHAVISSPQAQLCVKTHLAETEREHRKRLPTHKFFSSPEMRHTMTNACAWAEGVWVESKWGKCGEYFFQTDRNLPKKKMRCE